MKKLLASLTALALVASLSACGSKEASSTTPASSTEPEKSEEVVETTTEETVYHVGIIQLVQHAALDAATEGFQQALKDNLGDAVVFDYQNAAGDAAQCSTIATGFVSNEYDLIMANATPAVQAAINATTTIPVLGTSVTDYATALGQDELTNGATGINLSGTSDGVDAQLYVNCLLELVPTAKNVSIVYCSAEPNSVVQADAFIAAMKETNPDVTCTVTTFADSNDIQTAVTTAVQDCDAMYIPTDNTAASNMTLVSNVTIPAGIPLIAGEENMCKAGGLATVSISYFEIGYTCGVMAYEILANGADVSTMPIQYAQSLVGEYNASYAEAIGITIPDSYEALAAE